jgi:penicillin-binding protein 2
MAAQFGFGQLSGIDINEESPGLLPSTKWMNRRYGEHGWTKGFLPSLGIGQGEVGVTPLQMAVYVMMLANEGHYYQPHAVRTCEDHERNVVDTLKYRSRTVSISQSSWNVVREGMRKAVMEPGGTGGQAKVKDVVVAGKTGTAQNTQGKKDHSWFIGFAPFDHPKIAICVLVENVGFGGSFAAPIAGQCIEQYLYGRLIRNDRPAVQSRIASQPGQPPTPKPQVHASND